MYCEKIPLQSSAGILATWDEVVSHAGRIWAEESIICSKNSWFQVLVLKKCYILGNKHFVQFL